MNREQWKKLKELFQAAADQKPEARRAFVADACRDDPFLSREIQYLLDAETTLGDFLETSPFPESPALRTSERRVGMRIGQYLLQRVISSGGMGTVYEALQEHPKRTVAVKVMKDGIASKSVLRRFEFEAQVLAGLTHPHIAQVIEAGTHTEEDASLPYFVMEYIRDARPITDYAREKDLSVRERLELFKQVCDAVHHGHQKGVIHRDLKPANLLVDAGGHVKIIDFGVARSLDSDIQLTTLQTDMGQLIGTVQYMSPEQCRADPRDLDTRSDVYALGVVLYELLCEELPYDVRKVAVIEAARLISEAQPKRPSTVNRTLRGDVETIVLKALEKEREHRYQTVAEFEADIHRFLHGEIILAKPAGPVPRFLKTMKRRPVLSTASGVAGLSLLAFFLYVVLWSYPRLVEERNKAVAHGIEAERQRLAALTAKATAEQETAEKEAINEFLKSMLMSSDPTRGSRDIKVADWLDHAAQKVGEDFAGRPLIESQLRMTIGRTYESLSRFEEAEAQLEAAVDCLRPVTGDAHEDMLIVKTNLANVMFRLGKFSETEILLQEILEDARAIYGEEHELTLVNFRLLGNLFRDQGRFSEAENILNNVLEAFRRTLGEDHKDTLTTYKDLAVVYQEMGRYSEAETIHRNLFEAYRALKGKEHLETVRHMDNLCTLLLSQQRNDEAELLIRKALEVYERDLGEAHEWTLNAMNNLALVLKNTGRSDEAGKVQQRVLDLQRRVLGPEHPLTLNSMHNLAGIRKVQGRYDEAESLLREVIDLWRRVVGPEHPDTLKSMNNLGNVLKKLDKLEEAESIHRSTLEIRCRILGEEHPDTMSSMFNLAMTLGKQEKIDEAEALFDRFIVVVQNTRSKTDPLRLSYQSYYVDAMWSFGRFEKAEKRLLECYEGWKALRGAHHRQTRNEMNRLIELYEAWGKIEKAEQWRRELDH